MEARGGRGPSEAEVSILPRWPRCLTLIADNDVENVDVAPPPPMLELEHEGRVCDALCICD